MIDVIWTDRALAEFDHILATAASPAGARQMRSSVERAIRTISIFPRVARIDPATKLYEAVVRRVPLLIIYELVDHPAGLRAEIVGVFNTNRDPGTKPHRMS